MTSSPRYKHTLVIKYAGDFVGETVRIFEPDLQMLLFLRSLPGEMQSSYGDPKLVAEILIFECEERQAAQYLPLGFQS